jgi:hypothetical protein
MFTLEARIFGDVEEERDSLFFFFPSCLLAISGAQSVGAYDPATVERRSRAPKGVGAMLAVGAK